MPFHFELVTPERVVYRAEADKVTLPTKEGEITVLPDHAHLVAILVPGVAQMTANGNVEDIAVSGGFIEVGANKVRVLADTAERGHELDLTVIEQAKARAEKVMNEAVRTDDVSYALAAAALERELARYKVARKHVARHVPTIDRSTLPKDENPL